MPTLSDRLKALGVKIGTQDLPAPKKERSFPVEDIASGRFVDTGNGSTYLLEQDFSIDYIQGEVGLRISTKPQTIAEWAGNQQIAEDDLESLVFLDTETSGLAGGTGTFAFLVGVGRYTPAGFHLAQFFMRDPIDEPALLLALEEFLAPCRTVVSFNGKAFDVPLLDTRYILQGWKSPFKDFSHIDLLHLARRLWRDRLPSRTLANLEVQILHASRTDEEIPGWMIPQIYFDYLRDGDARPLLRVFYHNAMDVISLAALLNHTSLLLETPFSLPENETIELAAIGRLMEDLGHTDRAFECYERCLQANLPDDILPDDILNDTLQRLSFLHKRNNDYAAALPLWEQAVVRDQVYAYEELAKYYEHHALDIERARKWTLAALAYLETGSLTPFEKYHWMEIFQHRLERLERKISIPSEK
jgi:uncharacterized protein YprB with RNaseH-like and TPR domain